MKPRLRKGAERLSVSQIKAGFVLGEFSIQAAVKHFGYGRLTSVYHMSDNQLGNMKLWLEDHGVEFIEDGVRLNFVEVPTSKEK